MKQYYQLLAFLCLFISIDFFAQPIIMGTTFSGGDNNWGTIWSHDVNTGISSMEFSFPDVGNSPRGDLFLANDGKLYGVQRQGGLNSNGVIYSYDVSTGERELVASLPAGITTPRLPRNGVIQASNGKFYGATELGGVSQNGTIYEYDPVLDTVIMLHQFNGTNGSKPYGKLFQAANGLLYGTTNRGEAPMQVPCFPLIFLQVLIP
jgi:uncharacterized repeat protein (TIGR03803 family)